MQAKPSKFCPNFQQFSKQISDDDGSVPECGVFKNIEYFKFVCYCLCFVPNRAFDFILKLRLKISPMCFDLNKNKSSVTESSVQYPGVYSDPTVFEILKLLLNTRAPYRVSYNSRYEANFKNRTPCLITCFVRRVFARPIL
eukprot:GFUD01001237.1.p1 GENE.GFUD01001237.1~~GFUD01001237.1.p1  ORF type:complete len:141 (+),score=16.05 GFUD01001237.1:233-655(+)